VRTLLKQNKQDCLVTLEVIKEENGLPEVIKKASDAPVVINESVVWVIDVLILYLIV
jgi:hypothetical protein